MVTAWKFRIMLLVMGLVGIVSFLADFVDYRAFQVDGTPAVLQQSSKASPPGPAMFINDRVVHNFQVKYRTREGRQEIYERYVPSDIVKKLVDGGTVEILYLPDNPRRFIYKGEQLPMGGYWLAFGVGMIGLFALSLRLR